jgi:MFS family permease
VSVFGLSTCTAPIFGGALTDHVSWRWCFYINLPVGAVAMILIPIFVRVKPSGEALRNMSVLERLRRLDWLGTFLFTSSIVCLFLALQWGGQTKAWKDPVIIALLVVFAVVLAVFGWTQKLAGERALIPLRLLSQRTVLFGSIHLFFNYLTLSVVSDYFTLLDRSNASMLIPAVPLLSSYLFPSHSWYFRNK